MLILEPQDYLENYPHLAQTIASCREHFDERKLIDFAYKQITCEDDNIDDANQRARIQLLLALTHDYCEQDKPLIRWLLRENGKCYDINNYIALETTLAAFMLYKYMDWQDILVLYACKFAYGSNEQYMVDTEIALGFGLEETLDYLEKNSQDPMYAQMAHEIKLYCGKGLRLKPRAQFIDYFEQRRFAHVREELARDYGLIED